MKQQRVTRNDQRHTFECAVQISWLARSGDINSMRAKCLDLSSQGARILCDQPIELRTSVYVQSPGHGQLGNASVRYCSRSGLKYMIGLLFSSASSQADEGRKRCIGQIIASAEKATNS